jgi:hypothetical protein
MTKKNDDARAQGYKRGLDGKNDAQGLTQGWTDDKESGAARNLGYVEGKKKRSRNEADANARNKK